MSKDWRERTEDFSKITILSELIKEEEQLRNDAINGILGLRTKMEHRFRMEKTEVKGGVKQSKEL